MLWLVHGEPLKGHLDTMLLAALRDGPAHGYALVRLLSSAATASSCSARARSTRPCAGRSAPGAGEPRGHRRRPPRGAAKA